MPGETTIPSDAVHGPRNTADQQTYPLPEGAETGKLEEWTDWFDAVAPEGVSRIMHTTDGSGHILGSYEFTHHGPDRSAIRIEHYVSAGGSDRLSGTTLTLKQTAGGNYSQEAHHLKRVDSHVRLPVDITEPARSMTDIEFQEMIALPANAKTLEQVLEERDQVTEAA